MIKCKWTVNDYNGDLKFFCPKKEKTLTISREIVKATSHTDRGSHKHNDIIEKVKSRAVAEMGCNSCPQHLNLKVPD